MDIDIRGYIKNNFKDSTVDEIKDSIVESIDSKDEVVLPGLGVLFETVWINSTEEFKNNILNIIQSTFK